MRASLAVLVAAVAANALSWVLPAIDEYRGWFAFRTALSPLWEPGEFDDEPVWVLGLMIGSALTNVVFVALAALLVLGRRVNAVLYAAAAATLLNLHWVFTLETYRRYLAPGYFVWVCSFALLALAAFLAVRAGRR